MASRIIVAGAELNINFTEDINFNLKVNTLGDISNRNSSNSNSILIPRTSNNEAILGYVGLMGNTSDTPYTSLRCDYIVGGTYVVTNGYLQVIKTLEESYRIVIHDGIIDFAALLGNSVISDLPFTNENHILDLTTFEASMGNTEGYIYAMGDFGRTISNITEVESIAPSVYAHTIWDKIFTEAGITYTGDFFTTNTDWLTLVLPALRGVLLEESAAGEAALGTADTDTINDNTNYGTYITKFYQHDFTSDTLDGVNADLNGVDSIEALYTGTMNLIFDITYTQTNTRILYKVKRNGGTIYSFHLPYYPATDSPQQVDLTLEVTTGDLFTIHLEVDNPTPTGEPDDLYWTHVFSASTDVTVAKITGGTLIEVQDYMSTELTQKDFVKDILQRYGLIMIRNKINPNEYEFTAMEDLLEVRTNNIDWTEKLNVVLKEKYQNTYAQLNVADYTYASGVVPYLTGYLNVVNSNAPFSKTIITAPYEIPEQSLEFINNIRLFKFPIWEFNEDIADYDNIETSPKLMRLTMNSLDKGFSLWGSATHTITADIPYLTLDNMSYQDFIDTYYANLKQLLDSYKEITVDLDLDIVDYKLIDFSKLIYLRQTGRYYYLDSVRIKTNGATAKLIEIRNFTA